MAFPKWKYRKHPTLGVFQQTMVLTAEAEAELDADWSDDPASTGFEVRPASQIHTSHIVPENQLHEVVADANGDPLVADIKMETTGDVSNG
jgi:hypothetical protein